MSASNASDENRNAIDVMGIYHTRKKIDAGSLNVVGIASYSDVTLAGNIGVVGICNISGGLRSLGAHIVGILHIGRDAEMGMITGNGSLRADHAVKCERMDYGGRTHIGGLLTADDLTLRFDDGGYIRAVRAGNIRIRYEPHGYHNYSMLRGFWNAVRGTEKGCLFMIEKIAGRHIDIEHVNAKIIIGDDVVIGKGCIIDSVQYRSTLSVAGDATVKVSRKS